MRIGQFGCGKWGQNICRTLTDLGCAIRVCDPEVSDYTHMDVAAWADAFVVATPATTHVEIVYDLLDDWDRSIFVEKPMALSFDDARQIAAVDMVGHLMLYHPAFTELARRVAHEPIRFMQGVRYGGTERDEGPYWSLSIHDVAMATALDPAVDFHVEARFEAPEFRARRFTVLADHQYCIDHDDLWVDNERVEVPRIEPLMLEMRAFLDAVENGTPVLSDGAFGLEVTRRMEEYLCADTARGYVQEASCRTPAP